MDSPASLFTHVLGKTSYWPETSQVTEATLFDIGSLTKVVATTSVVARLYEKGKLQLTNRIAEVLPALKKTDLEAVALQDLLTHSSGLKSWSPWFLRKTSGPFSECLASEKSLVEYPRNSKTVYSDLGFLLLQEYLEGLLKKKIETLFEEEVKEPLKLVETCYFPKTDPKNIVATEYCHWRKKIVQGEVFDENTASMGGVSAFAGLFSPVKEVTRWGKEWLLAREGKSNWLSKKTAELFTRKAQGDRAIGFDTKSSGKSTLGSAFSLETFGHLGFPGASVWMDPTSASVVTFFCNRIHPSRLDERIREIRPRLHELVYEHLTSRRH